MLHSECQCYVSVVAWLTDCNVTQLSVQTTSAVATSTCNIKQSIAKPLPLSDNKPSAAQTQLKASSHSQLKPSSFVSAANMSDDNSTDSSVCVGHAGSKFLKKPSAMMEIPRVHDSTSPAVEKPSQFNCYIVFTFISLSLTQV